MLCVNIQLFGGRGSSSSMTGARLIHNLHPQVEYPQRVEYWKKQILAGNEIPILVDTIDHTEIISGNHALAAYKELGKTPEVYEMDWIKFANEAGKVTDTVGFIKDAIKKGKAKRVY